MDAPHRLLIVDDEVDLVAALVRHFRKRGYEPTPTYLVADALQAIEASVRSGRPFAAVITDLQLPDGDGGTVVQAARGKLPGVPVVMITGSGSVAGSVAAMRFGALTVLEKPVSMELLEAELSGAIADRAGLDAGLQAASHAGIVGTSPAIRAVLDTLFLAARTDATVLVSGETGTGKELVARALHSLSSRAAHPLVAVNCAALPETLLEGELFGSVKGAFTGAETGRPGRFRQANHGTLFLDEIGEIPLGVQAKLLRVLQDREVQPLGSDRAERVDVRIVAATNRNLEGQVAGGAFRADLFHRLNVVPLELPPLRERTSDIPALVVSFLRGRKQRFTKGALAALAAYRWPGNVRELENLVERLEVLKPEGDLTEADLPAAARNPAPAPAAAPSAPASVPPGVLDLYAVLGELEDRLIREALEKAGGNKSEAARGLGINRTTLVEKLRKISRRP